MLVNFDFDVLYLQNVVSNFEKGWNGQSHSSDLYHPIKKSSSKILHPPTGGVSPTPLDYLENPACLCLKPVLLGIHSLIFLKFDTMILSQ